MTVEFEGVGCNNPLFEAGQFLIVVITVARLIVQSHNRLPLNRIHTLSGGKFGGRFSKKAVMPSMKSGRSIDSCISFSATALASNTSRMVSAYTCCLITARELGAQFAAMSSA